MKRCLFTDHVNDWVYCLLLLFNKLRPQHFSENCSYFKNLQFSTPTAAIKQRFAYSRIFSVAAGSKLQNYFADSCTMAPPFSTFCSTAFFPSIFSIGSSVERSFTFIFFLFGRLLIDRSKKSTAPSITAFRLSTDEMLILLRVKDSSHQICRRPDVPLQM